MATEIKNGSAEPNAKQLAEAEKYKVEANDYFKSKLIWIDFNLLAEFHEIFFFSDKAYDKAIEFYTKAIELDPQNAVFYANRSLANLRIESFG